MAAKIVNEEDVKRGQMKWFPFVTCVGDHVWFHMCAESRDVLIKNRCNNDPTLVKDEVPPLNYANANILGLKLYMVHFEKMHGFGHRKNKLGKFSRINVAVYASSEDDAIAIARSSTEFNSGDVMKLGSFYDFETRAYLFEEDAALRGPYTALGIDFSDYKSGFLPLRGRCNFVSFFFNIPKVNIT
jgi:hypothetical protein